MQRYLSSFNWLEARVGVVRSVKQHGATHTHHQGMTVASTCRFTACNQAPVVWTRPDGARRRSDLDEWGLNGPLTPPPDGPTEPSTWLVKGTKAITYLDIQPTRIISAGIYYNLMYEVAVLFLIGTCGRALCRCLDRLAVWSLSTR